MEGFIFVSLDFHDDSTSHDIDEPYSRVIGCHHGNILIEEIDTGDFSASRELPVVVLDIDGFLQLKFFNILRSLLRHGAHLS